MIFSDPVAAAPAISSKLDKAHRILLLTHVYPDGDAISSLLGMWHMLRNRGKTPIALASSSLPAYVHMLPGCDHIHIYERDTSLPDVDVICMVDTAGLDRTGPIYDDHSDILLTRPLIVIDHHVTNTGEGKVNLIDADAASCADLICRLIQALGDPMTPELATCLLLGIYTDTLSYQTNSTTAKSLRAAADLLDAGADHAAIMNSVYKSIPYSTIQLMGLAFTQAQRSDGIIWTHITQEMLRQTCAEDGASDDIVNLLSRIAGMRVCTLFKERQNGDTKISLRSAAGIDVAEAASVWGGGGHTQAAGATLHMPPECAEEEVISYLHKTLS